MITPTGYVIVGIYALIQVLMIRTASNIKDVNNMTMGVVSFSAVINTWLLYVASYIFLIISLFDFASKMAVSKASEIYKDKNVESKNLKTAAVFDLVLEALFFSMMISCGRH